MPLIFALLIIMTVAVGFLWAKEGSEAVPVVEFEQPIHKFEQVSQGTIVKHNFRVFNRGKAPLEIKKVKPG
jgi:hypothetical protein